MVVYSNWRFRGFEAKKKSNAYRSLFSHPYRNSWCSALQSALCAPPLPLPLQVWVHFITSLTSNTATVSSSTALLASLHCSYRPTAAFWPQSCVAALSAVAPCRLGSGIESGSHISSSVSAVHTPCAPCYTRQQYLNFIGLWDDSWGMPALDLCVLSVDIIIMLEQSMHLSGATLLSSK
ncbi:unspecified product [Leishmania tarentolae]|uniref:Unspecified product n=1 Tax=Leishmania tarentolae TaxID=5689 RepID=A0A640KJZ9_LEITA|nr:unspecified product [Leishmania tarentolae]